MIAEFSLIFSEAVSLGHIHDSHRGIFHKQFCGAFGSGVKYKSVSTNSRSYSYYFWQLICLKLKSLSLIDSETKP